MEASKKFKTVEEYFNTFPKETVEVLESLRNTIKKAAPQADELISYNMPAFRQKGMLVYYAAWKTHIGLYPASVNLQIFDKDLEGYERTKGTIKFPLDKPLPLDLISKIVKYRVEENEEKSRLKKNK
ncbi:iron chaperone [Owenweeksia hongkongensis]|uniref:iron chaperone n=1 Tax=Owenweeksia hongkongensis TaxID=253245 RepID=UPI003A94A52E